MVELQRKLQDVRNTQDELHSAAICHDRFTESTKKMDHKSTIFLNNVHYKVPKWRWRHYTDQRNKSKTLKAKVPRKSKTDVRAVHSSHKTSWRDVKSRLVEDDILYQFTKLPNVGKTFKRRNRTKFQWKIKMERRNSWRECWKSFER